MRVCFVYNILLCLILADCCQTGRLFIGSVGVNHPDLLTINGVYIQQESRDARGFPVFKHEKQDFYLYHIRGNLLGTAPPSGYWAIGLTIGSPEAVISARSEGSHPEEVSLNWRVWDSLNRDWHRERRLKAVCVTEDFVVCETGYLRLHGLAAAHALQSKRLGLYRITSQIHELRPVYQHITNDQYLFFHHGMWLIGPVLGKVAGGLFVPDNAWRPEFIVQDWVVFNGWVLDNDPVLRISCEGNFMNAPIHLLI